ncbi:hypothetical protein AS859_09150, partial [Aliarcobacter cryaerophilus]
MQKRVTKNSVCDIAVFIDEAQRVVSKEFDLPIDVLREAKVELFLSYQNEDLMIEKIGLSAYQALYKNLSHRFVFKNNEIGLSKLKSFEYKDLSKKDSTKTRVSKPIFLEDKELFDVEKEYQDSLKLHDKYGIDEKYKNMILVSDVSLFDKYQVVLKDENSNN